MKVNATFLTLIFFITCLLIFNNTDIYSRDFPDPVGVYAPPPSNGQVSGLLPGFYGMLQHSRYMILHDEWDSWYFRTIAAPIFWEARNGLNIGGRFGTVLSAGPVREGQTPASISEFWLNSVQFEYALHTLFPIGSGIKGIIEYARTSQHPFKSEFSQTASDQVNLILMIPSIGLIRPYRIETYIRLGYADLFDFWKSKLPKPKTMFAATPMIICKSDHVYVWLSPDILFQRNGGTAIDFYSEAGVFLTRGNNRVELFIECYFSKNSEILIITPEHKAREIGFGIRFSTGSRK